MSAYILVNIATVKDPVAYEEYKAKAPALVRKHGGEYLVRGGKSAVVEGDWRPNRVVVLRFPDMAAVRSFYDDPEYEPLKAPAATCYRNRHGLRGRRVTAGKVESCKLQENDGTS